MSPDGIGNDRTGLGATRYDRIAPIPFRDWLAPRCYPALFLVAMLAAAGLAAAASDGRPGVFLQGATVPRAKGLALDAALIKGWRVARTERTSVVFETYLDEPASMGPPGAVAPDRTLLRIQADFAQTPVGVNVYLYAEEIWYPGAAKEWASNVTPHYRPNLANALSSLQAQWTEIAGERSPAPPGTPTASDGAPKVRTSPLTAPPASAPTSGQPLPVAPPPAEVAADPDVGTWAYHAERFAQDRGCALSDRGAELVTSSGDGELHRVHCRDGTTLKVQCDRETCYGVR